MMRVCVSIGKDYWCLGYFLSGVKIGIMAWIKGLSEVVTEVFWCCFDSFSVLKFEFVSEEYLQYHYMKSKNAGKM